jgi:hypothetical protein
MKLDKLLLERLSDPASSGVYRVADGAALETALALGRHDFTAIELRGSKEEILEAIARSLGFPDWFGGNWDALEDCLTDLSPGEGGNRIILFKAEVDNDDMRILLDVLSSVAEFWKERKRPFFAVFHDPKRTLKVPSFTAGKGAVG